MPKPVLALAELRALEARAAARGDPLMQRAGAAVAAAAEALARDTGEEILVVAGPGNNGGDAWVAAARLAETFHRVTLVDVTGNAPKAEAARAAREQLGARGGAIVRDWPDASRPALVVDGLLGVGLDRDVDPAFAGVIARINGCAAPVLAIDVPSGLDAASGAIRGSAVRAARTITFIAHKPGLHTGDGLDCRGELVLDDLGLGEEAAREAHGSLLDAEAVRAWLAPRARNSHKGAFGTLAVVGGNRGMVGAALLAARAGLLCGAGKVRLGLLAPDPPAVDLAHAELMLGPVDDALAMDVIVAGPGAGRSPSATSVSAFERTVLPALLASAKPLVLDADALNALAYSDTLRHALDKRRAPTILTPHPAEAARLLGRKTADVQAQRLESALEIASHMHAHVVLKGAGSICAFPDARWSINTTGNPGLASGGTGDVLAGMIGALLCQGLDAERALQYAVCLHGAAADACVARGLGPIGLTASEVALEARAVMNQWTIAA
jgi:hydroxyethylthiazole kinase-like uncharacterized protein yjeF